MGSVWQPVCAERGLRYRRWLQVLLEPLDFYVHRQGDRLMRLHQIAVESIGIVFSKVSSHAVLHKTQSKHQFDSLSLVLIW